MPWLALLASAVVLSLMVLLGWHLLNRYSMLTSVLDLDAQVRGGQGGGGRLGKGVGRRHEGGGERVEG